MAWELAEAMDHYRRQGAPGDQGALVNLLKEVQAESGGSIPPAAIDAICRAYGCRESLLLALIRRIPSLRLGQTHTLEVCAGPNCGKAAALAAYAENLRSDTVSVRFVPCMRQCGKGPNIRFDGTLHNRADEALLRKLTKQ